MCTMGMARKSVDSPLDLLFSVKTVDTPATSLNFEKRIASSGMEFLSFQMGWQAGINAGINEEGLTELLSRIDVS